MAFRNVLASVAVKDLAAALTWYEQVLGKAPDSRPMAEVAEWKFPGGGWLQVYRRPERAGQGSFTLAVTHLEEHISQLDRLGVDTTERLASDRVHTVMIVDPDGNHIAFAEVSDPTMAQ